MSAYYGGLGPMTNGVLWAEVVVAMVFVGLRLYTRRVILNSVGADDILAVACLLIQFLYNIFVSIASVYGLGRKYAAVGNPVVYFTAVKYELFSQVAGIMAIGVGKLAVGAFLLRIVRNKVQIWFIHACIAITVIITLFASITVVVQCSPVERSWNPTVKGHCWLNFYKVGYTVGSWFVAADFSFAILPWFIIWNLNMKQKERITVACGLSLGVLAGVCGIVRTVALAGLNAQEYIYDTVPMLLWSATECSVTLMCSSIPVMRPLYDRIRHGKDGKSQPTGQNGSYNMNTYGNGRKYGKLSVSGKEHSNLDPNGTQKTIITYNERNASDEAIIQDGSGIARTDEVSVSYEPYSRKV